MQFHYEARTEEGDLQVGTVEASDREAAVIVLKRHGLIIVNLASSEELPSWARSFNLFSMVKARDLVIFSRQLATLFEAQVPLVEAFRTLIKQTSNRYFQGLIFNVMSDIEGGMSLSKALAKHPRVFSSFYVSMVHSGEVSGQLQDVFSYLADHTEKDYYLRSRIRGAMIYPAFVIGAFFIIGLVMLLVVVPQLTAILRETGQELPLITKILISFSDFVRVNFLLLLVFFIIILAGFIWYVRTPGGTMFWDRVKLRIPIVGGLLRKIYLTRFAENLSTLTAGGLPIIQSLTVTADVIDNTVYKEIIREAIEEVKSGGSISSVLSRYDAIPPMFAQMVSTGEKTGKLSQILTKVSVFYQKEVDDMTNNLTRLIEPILILLLGGMVGLLVAAILLPLYNIAQGF